MLMIKLQMIGKKHQRSFRLIVGEKRTKLNGRQLEDLGWYNPHTKKGEFRAERVQHWVKNGAQPTETVKALLKKQNIVV